MEEKVGDERKIKYRDEVVINLYDILRNFVYSFFLSFNLERYELLENRDVVVIICNEIIYVIDNFCKCFELKYCNFG